MWYRSPSATLSSGGYRVLHFRGRCTIGIQNARAIRPVKVISQILTWTLVSTKRQFSFQIASLYSRSRKRTPWRALFIYCPLIAERLHRNVVCKRAATAEMADDMVDTVSAKLMYTYLKVHHGEVLKGERSFFEIRSFPRSGAL